MTEGLEFFNRLSGHLKIDLTKAPERAAPHMLNLVAPKDAKVLRVELALEVRVRDATMRAVGPDTYALGEPPVSRALTDEEWSCVVIEASRIRMASVDTDEIVIEHDAPDGRAFTVRDLRAAIEKTEAASRDRGEWLGGVDVHHVFFEGISLEEGVWIVCWGS